LTFAAKNNELKLWASVETTAPVVERKFCLVWTGREPKGRYIGTAHTFEESTPPGYGSAAEEEVITWHLFETTPAIQQLVDEFGKGDTAPVPRTR
jgi:hypothetical protein